MFTQKDYNYIKLKSIPDNLTVEEYSEILNNLQKEYGITRAEAYSILEHDEDAVAKIIERRGMQIEIP